MTPLAQGHHNETVVDVRMEARSIWHWGSARDAENMKQQNKVPYFAGSAKILETIYKAPFGSHVVRAGIISVPGRFGGQWCY